MSSLILLRTTEIPELKRMSKAESYGASRDSAKLRIAESPGAVYSNTHCAGKDILSQPPDAIPNRIPESDASETKATAVKEIVPSASVKTKWTLDASLLQLPSSSSASSGDEIIYLVWLRNCGKEIADCLANELHLKLEATYS
jgi:hypothetical protein